MARTIKYAFFGVLCGLLGAGQGMAVNLGEPASLPSAWSSSVDSASCREAGRLQVFLDYAAKNSDHSAQERMLVSVAYAQGKQLFAALVEIIDVFDREAGAWAARREHPLWYRLKQGPWRWVHNKQSPEREIDDCLGALKQQRGVFACHLGELNKAMHEMYDACEQNSQANTMQSLQRLVDVERVILMSGEHETSKSSAPSTEVSVRIIENMGKIVNFKRNSLATLKQLNIPNHWSRNCTVYAAAAIGLTAVGVYLYCKRNQLPVWKQKINEQAIRFWNEHLKNKFDTIKNIFWSDKKEEDKLKQFCANIKQLNDQHALLVKKNAVAGLMATFPGLTENQATERVADAIKEHRLMSLLDECSQGQDKSFMAQIGKVMQNFEKERVTAVKDTQEWFNSGKVLRTILPTEGREKVTECVAGITAAVKEAPQVIPAASDYLPKQKNIMMAMVYNILEPVTRFMEVGVNKASDIEQKTIKNNELTFAALAVAAPATALYVGYRWLTSLDQWAKNIRNELVRFRTLLDRSSTAAMTEQERQGMIIYVLYHLKKEAHGVPADDKKRFDADLAFLQSSQATDEQKIQRIDSFLGPYKFLQV